MIQNKTIKAIDAIQEAQKIAFAPFVFQAVIAMRKLKIMELIFNQRKKGGISAKDIAKELSISKYGVKVLLEIAESSDVVYKTEENNYFLTTIGYFLTYNETVNVNINFTQEVCYKGLFHLTEAIKTGNPEGLKELGNWATIYEGLSQLEPEQQKSWFEFDHHYSDDIFGDALQEVYKLNPKKLYDIGGNTGKFAVKCCQNNEDVNVTIFDLPGQLSKALLNAETNGLSERINGFEIDWLSKNPKIPQGADVIWMCQFLDCFSKKEILKVLNTCQAAMDANTRLIIIETYTDRQRFENARFALEATSLYFTVMANGNSKMYQASEIMKVVEKAGLEIEKDLPLGEYHSMFICKKAV
ncbi:MAG: SAM-dependent methyltransferase [Mangrovimonas sp.]|nr:SAM-dependent methyltransferase [Mangrovimonas sp.]